MEAQISRHPHSATSRRPIPWTAGVLLIAALALGGCTADLPVQPERARAGAPAGPAMTNNPACAGSGTYHYADTITSLVRWEAAGNPHIVVNSAVVQGAAGELRIRAGAVVCFVGRGRLVVRDGGRLAVDGHDTARVLLTADWPAFGWGGIQLAGSPAAASFIRNARVEHVAHFDTAVSAQNRHAVLLDSVVVRQSGRALALRAPGSRVLRSWIDTTTNAQQPAVVLGDSTRFTGTTIRGAAGVGLRVDGRSGVELLGGRIEGSGGVGLTVSRPAAVTVGNPVRVTGGATYGAQLSAGAVAALYPTLADQDSLLGNARDTLIVDPDSVLALVTAGGSLPWRVTGRVWLAAGGVLQAKPRARVTFEGMGQIVAWPGRVSARGSAAAPVVFTAADSTAGWQGVTLMGTPSSPSYLTSVRIQFARYNTAVTAVDAHTVVIDSAVFRHNQRAVYVSSNGSRLVRTRVDSTTLAGLPAVQLGADVALESTLIRGSAGVGLRISSPDVQVYSCEVSGNGGAGIAMYASARVRNCNVHDNAGLGMDATFAFEGVNATDNWWGDAAGPTGPGADGVTARVAFTPWRTTPYILSYVP